nr:GNAT family N-acetyltransferase [Streptomyces sulphureus]
MPEAESPAQADFRIRTAHPGEAAEVLEFWHVAAEGTSITDDVEGVERLLGRDADSLLLAEDAAGRLLGSVIAGFDGWRCHLYRLAVHPAARRRGVARALLAAAEERFLALGGRRGDAMVLQENAPAHAVWSAAGYAPQQEWRRWVRPLP